MSAKMEEFISRTVSIKVSDVIEIFRTRTSAGYASITLRIAGKDGPRDLTFTDKGYEQVVRQVIDGLEAIVSNPCNLPTAREPGKGES